ncbi:MAG: hypothetical protein Q9203_002141 [Teloschistes exilis]
MAKTFEQLSSAVPIKAGFNQKHWIYGGRGRTRNLTDKAVGTGEISKNAAVAPGGSSSAKSIHLGFQQKKLRDLPHDRVML